MYVEDNGREVYERIRVRKCMLRILIYGTLCKDEGKGVFVEDKGKKFYVRISVGMFM